jgi:hypothetical protein
MKRLENISPGRVTDNPLPCYNLVLVISRSAKTKLNSVA